MTNRKYLKFILYIVSSISIVACGSSSSSSDTSTTDTTAPVITITGDNPLTVSKNSTYTELGATAIDAVDGTVSVSSSGSVDTSTVASYTITYTATDAANNTATATRTVTVSSPTDITDKVFTNGSGNCEDYVAAYSSAVTDIQNDSDFEGALTIEVSDGKCSFSSNIIPNHDFNDVGANFSNPVETQSTSSVEITTSPVFASSTTDIDLGNNAIFLNGVKLSIISAGCFGVKEDSSFEDGYSGVSGCNDINEPFRYDPLGVAGHFGADEHNAHTENTGTYHYHGSPLAMYDTTGAVESAVIGFARDGYPIFGSYITENSTVRKVTSSYVLKSGSRASVTYNGNTYNPGGTYDGTYTSDWEYTLGSGDLDECNGMTVDSVYGYYAIDTYPWVLNCYKGTPDSSFGR